MARKYLKDKSWHLYLRTLENLPLSICNWELLKSDLIATSQNRFEIFTILGYLKKYVRFIYIREINPDERSLELHDMENTWVLDWSRYCEIPSFVHLKSGTSANWVLTKSAPKVTRSEAELKGIPTVADFQGISSPLTWSWWGI